MRVLVACEFSGTVRDAFLARGHDAWSCDLLPTEGSLRHIQADAREVLGWGWDLMVAHPPCTYLSLAGARWWKVPGRAELADEAAEFVFALRDAPIPRIAITRAAQQALAIPRSGRSTVDVRAPIHESDRALAQESSAAHVHDHLL